MKGGIKSINTPIYDITLYELLKTYANINMQKSFQTINIPKLPVFTTEEGIKHINKNLENLDTWKNINDLIPKYYKNNKMLKTGSAGLLAACLELTKQGHFKYRTKKNLW